jgi:transcriptional regulator with XRE-family HTH domain
MLREFKKPCDKDTFGGVLRRIRQAHDMSLIQLGERIHYSKTHLSRWENDDMIPPDLNTVHCLADGMDCSEAERAQLRKHYVCAVLRSRRIIPA